MGRGGAAPAVSVGSAASAMTAIATTSAATRVTPATLGARLAATSSARSRSGKRRDPVRARSSSTREWRESRPRSRARAPRAGRASWLPRLILHVSPLRRPPLALLELLDGPLEPLVNRFAPLIAPHLEHPGAQLLPEGDDGIAHQVI